MSVGFRGAHMSWICVEAGQLVQLLSFDFRVSGLKCSDHDFKYFSRMFEQDDIGH